MNIRDEKDLLKTVKVTRDILESHHEAIQANIAVLGNHFQFQNMGR